MKRPRGICGVCGHVAALRNDGMIWRHWAGFATDGTCQGWGRAPVQAGCGNPSCDVPWHQPKAEV